jgi:predicted Zn-dependent protease
MNPENENLDEERWSALFSAGADNAAAPDEKFLHRLRERTAHEFLAHNPQKSTPSVRRRPMFIFTPRGMAATAATVVVAALVLFTVLAPSATAVPADKVFASVNKADSLHLSITRDDATSEIWTKKPDQLRWNNPDGTYKIAKGERLWLVDEKANQASSTVCRYFAGGKLTAGALGILSLLELPLEKLPENPQFDQEAKPALIDGKPYNDYRLYLTADKGRILIRVLVDPNTHGPSILETSSELDGIIKPIAKMTFISANQPAPEDIFVVGDVLTEDGRIGKITDVQGIVGLRPVMGKRWTPVIARTVLKPGDWVRTDPRGANAVALRLVKQTDVTFGPGSSAELVGPKQIRLFEGEIKISAEENSPLEILVPGGQKISVSGRQVFRLDNDKLVKLDKDPLWLKGFEGATANESIGSLIAKVDGRDVPLTVGYHKVSVDIRDQIARTVIEESFVNHTPSRLEGVFQFPLPPDASISGFGMWIGSELVEADVVEKQRAREIYETILREKRDPGLLEWSGGNMFKARVFPIEPNSEKRIKITYTQVLTLKGDQYRYSYPLQSEMLKQHPLRELNIDVTLNSAVPLKNVTSPTHSVRSEKTEHSAKVEFAAKEYTPTRDFEVLVQAGAKQSDVVMIPHRRGEDGYFMLQLTAPADDGQWRREVLPDGEPMNLLILADTSASIDTAGRAAQAEFLAALLGALTPNDTFNLAGCDVNCDWIFDKPAAADEKNIAAARDFLANRTSLGWTDLDKAFAKALEQAGPKTQIIYIGDGIPTAQGMADPVDFAKRLRRLYEGKTAVCHAITLSSSFEAVVVKTIAALGGGSLRQITAENTPQSVAAELLQELARPGLKNVKVQFNGLRTARVYPAELPNVPAGSQQIILGRYLPEGRDQQGEVIVTGDLAGKPVRYSSKASLADAEQGNSFIPRLWARMHLDALLEQGASQAIQEEIIALSEEYHIITPYTSLLVLESDADRERFKVKRGFQMRDGEKFFAQGRDNANYELVQQQMKLAGNWRVGLRGAVLSQLAALGRASLDGQQEAWQQQGLRRPVGGFGGGRGGMYLGLSELNKSELEIDNGNLFAGIVDSYSGEVTISGGSLVVNGPAATSSPVYFGDKSGNSSLSINGRNRYDLGMEFESLDEDNKSLGRRNGLERLSEPYYLADKQKYAEMPFDISDGDLHMKSAGSKSSSSLSDWQLAIGGRGESKLKMLVSPRILVQEEEEGSLGLGNELSYFTDSLSRSSDKRAGLYARYRIAPQQNDQWLSGLFPGLAPVEQKKPVKEPKTKWSAGASALAQSLLHNDALAQLKDGLEISRANESFDARWGDVTSKTETLSLISTKTWLIRSQGGGQQTTAQWCDDKERGIFTKTFQLGRIRASAPSDLAKPPVDVGPYMLASLEKTYPQYQAEIKPQGDDRTLLVLKHQSDPAYEIDVMIDVRRHVILWIESRRDGKPAGATRFGDFVEVAGAWWPGRIETFDDENRRTSLSVQQFKPVDTNVLGQDIAKELADRGQIQFLHEPLPKFAAAKQAVADGKASFEDQIVLALHFAQSQQWTRAQEYLDNAEKLCSGKPGACWMRYAFLNVSRRREELKQNIMAEAEQLAKMPALTPDPSPKKGEGRADTSGPSPKKGEGRDGFSLSDQWSLANHLIGQSSGILEANEMLALLDALKPVFERQPQYMLGQKQWRQQRLNYLRQTGRSDEWLALQAELAKQYPHDVNSQQQYAQDLYNSGNRESAYAWLAQSLADNARWLPNEEETLRNCYCQFLEQEGRYPELVDYLAGWIKRNPPNTSAYQRYLSALVKSGRMDEAYAAMELWLKEGQIDDRLPQEKSSKLHAAIQQALGQGHNLYTNNIDERWLKPLADAALFFAKTKYNQSYADSIMNHWRFQQSDQCKKLRNAAADILKSDTEKLSADPLQRYINWAMSSDPPLEKETWKRLADELHKRWTAEIEQPAKDRWAGMIVQVLSSKIGFEQHLAFLREKLEKAPQEQRAACVRDIYNLLLNQPWSAERENELLSLVDKLSDDEEPAKRLVAEISALQRLTDRMVQTRYEAAMAKIEHQEKMTRTELAAKRAENMKLAREGYADRLKQEVQKRSGAVLPWINAERLYLDIILGRDLDRAAEDCWEFVGAKPKPAPAADGNLQAALDRILQNRCLVMIMNLAARKNAKPEAIDRLLKYLDEALTADPENRQWKILKYQMLVALDRPKDLQQAMQSWIKPDKADNFWRLTLAYLMAEQGKIADAVKLFEDIRATDELGPKEYLTLANWYMVLDRRDQYERAMVESYKVNDEWRLQNWLSQQLRPWQIWGNAKPPAELDKEVILVFNAIFEKSGNPQNYLWQLSEFYKGTRDFRLLACLADGVIGHTAGQVYPFLQNMGSVLGEIRDEATADSLVEQIEKVRARAKTEIDRRALDLLELLVERRAAELKNQPGPHAEKALAALQRAFKRQWSDGEKRLMADFLAALGAIPDAKLAEEQVRELETLHGESAPGSLDRLMIGLRLANAHWNYARRDRAIDLLQSALDEYQNALNGVLSAAANEALGAFVSYLEQTTRHARGEKVLQDQLKHPCNRQQTFWLTQRLYELYENAIRNNGDASLGNGETLYRAVEKNIQNEMNSGDENNRAAFIGRLCGIYRAAHEKKFSTVAEDIKTFAMKRLPEVLKLQTNNYQNMVNQVADALHDIAGSRDALAFLIDRVEHEPAWFRLNNMDSWNQFGWKIAQYRVETKNLGDLEERLLNIVCAELRRDLESRQTHSGNIYRMNYGDSRHFWAEKADVFAKTAEEVLAQRKNSSASVVYIAQYFFHGLLRFDRAIEILLDAHKNKVLDEGGQAELVRYLHEQNRHGESIPILLPLVERKPDNMQYRVWLMHAYFRTNRPAELLALLKQTDAYFHENNRWNEGAMAALAASCLENQLYEQSVEYYKELIPLHQRTQPNRGIGNGTLSDYYGKMALAYAGLKNTVEAVDAACGAIVSWGPRIDQRKQAVDSLKSVLRQSPDLDAYVADLDKQCAENGLQNPIVRKAVGQVYAERQQYARAIAQLKLASEVQPNDAETYKQLIDCYDKQGDKAGAIELLLRAVQLSRRDINLYQDLGKRYESLGNGKETERAFTSIVEVQPNESESHAALGEIRQGQNRWSDAADCWRQVAKIRALEPTGLQKLAAAQIQLRQWAEADETIRKLETTGWPTRFQNMNWQIQQLRRDLEERKKQQQ